MPFPTPPTPPPEPNPHEPASNAPSLPPLFPEIISSAPVPTAAELGFERFVADAEPPRWRTYALHLGLFLITLFTTTLAGVQLTRGGLGLLPILELGTLPAAEWARGLWFAVPFLGVLTVHEFGHYFTARANRVRSSLPYFIPFPLGLGTFGAVIRLKERLFARREFFDIGLAGPLAGFLVAVPVLIYGFLSLPPLEEYLFKIHPEYARFGSAYPQFVYGPNAAAQGLTLAKPLLYQLLEVTLADPTRLPHPLELLHYPVLLAGALALFFTALNLLPIGQLDGGHILYGLLGHRRFNRLSTLFFTGFIFYAGLGLFSLSTDRETWLYWAAPYALYLFVVFRRVLPGWRRAVLLGGAVWLAQLALTLAVPGVLGNPGWLVFGLVLSRLTGIYHPPAPNESPLSPGRRVLGWLLIGIFVLCFTPTPFK
ncbi:site-2 protease family protein [uncultured Hymenobacter sp.]|uniref:site-2 protease family protein n=1 Tax=uncultured Hymenobacter sp. TaxID=170016 RepID=UPI0035CC619E